MTNSAPRSRGLRRFLRRGQAGQSIIILAIGFIALLGFVGIVTDVSLLFVRYSTLRRAVDAAAIAAAGQLRRTVEPGWTEAEIQANSLANLHLAARSFIEMYGLDPSNVLVETCYTQNVALVGGNNDRPTDRTGTVELYLYDANGSVTGDNPAANPEDRRRYEQLCTRDELKLVRVTAQLDSQTVFLRLFGFGTVTLEESAISQTAVIDVVLMLDVSESMAYDTTYADYEPAYNWRYFPPQLVIASSGPDWDVWNDNLGRSQAQINALLTNADGIPGTRDDIAKWVPTGQTPTTEIRSECQVRFWPRSAYNQYTVSPAIAAEYTARGFTLSLNNRSVGFVPAVDYYGCCNDPNLDGNMSDLVCEPFKVVRDSAANFLDRLDFIRGDRVAFVTFDRTAYIMDPDGVGLQNAFIETRDDINAPRPEDDRVGAARVLDERVGVRTEPSFYVDTGPGNQPDGTWDGFRSISPDAPRVNTVINGQTTQVGYVSFATASNFYANTQTGRMFDHPVRESCFLDGAYQHPTYSLIDFYPTGNPGEGVPRAPLGVNPINRSPLDDIVSPPWLATSGMNFYRARSYEFRAGCRGSNIASSLEAAGTTFFRFGRREGSVWIMVLLSDGAAGGSDPILRQYPDGPDSGTEPDERLAVQPDPYAGFSLITVDDGGNPVTPAGYAVQGVPGDYGAYGLCPYGTATADLANSNAELVRDNFFPYCSDQLPQSRHFCAPSVINPRNMAINRPDAVRSAGLDGSLLACEEIYDVDDYARDWADFIGLSGLNTTGGGQLGDERLPTIFTIGFGIRFLNTNAHPACAALPSGPEQEACNRRNNNVSDYLGEELLRYIADVGDNARIDNDYWQALMSVPGSASPPGNFSGLTLPRIPNSVSIAWGPRGACETPTGAQGTWNPLGLTQDCGNYFNIDDVTDQQGLNTVFNEIASRMFLRLAQ